MELILIQKVKNLGNLGDKVRVKPGYGRNFLVPQGKAVSATATNLAEFEKRRAEYESKANQQLSAADARKAQLEGASITIKANASPEGKLFGSVTVSDVAHAVEEQTKVVIDRKNLHMEPIKSLGTHTVTAKLHNDVEFPITVEVVSK